MSESLSLEGRRIALVGGAGFIGHNLALALKERGAEVSIVDSLQVNNLLAFSAGNRDLPNEKLYRGIIDQRLDLLRDGEIPILVQDARDYHALARILDTLKVEVIVHLAAIAHAGESNKDPYSTFGHSLRTLENALDCARMAQVEHFVFFSSSMVYGDFQRSEVDEEEPLDPLGIYGALKLAGEKFVIAYNQVFDLPYTIIRPSALYGPRCVSRRVVQVFIENAIEGKPLRVVGDGEERLDFTYIDDLIGGVELVLENESSRGEIFNLTCGSARSIGEVADIVRDAFPGTVVESVERDRLVPSRGTLSVEKARRLLGFAPQNSIDVGVPKYIDWYRALTSTNGQ